MMTSLVESTSALFLFEWACLLLLFASQQVRADGWNLGSPASVYDDGEQPQQKQAQHHPKHPYHHNLNEQAAAAAAAASLSAASAGAGAWAEHPVTTFMRRNGMGLPPIYYDYYGTEVGSVPTVIDDENIFQVTVPVPVGEMGDNLEVSLEDGERTIWLRGQVIVSAVSTTDDAYAEPDEEEDFAFGIDDSNMSFVSSFSHRFDLDHTVETDRIMATLQDGNLVVTAPKNPAKRNIPSRTIPIHNLNKVPATTTTTLPGTTADSAASKTRLERPKQQLKNEPKQEDGTAFGAPKDSRNPRERSAWSSSSSATSSQRRPPSAPFSSPVGARASMEKNKTIENNKRNTDRQPKAASAAFVDQPPPQNLYQYQDHRDTTSI